MIEPVELADLPAFEGVGYDLLGRIAARAADLRVRAGEYAAHEGETNVRAELSSEIVRADGTDRLQTIDILDRKAGTTARHETAFVFVFIGADAQTSWLPSEIGRDARGFVVTGTRVPHCELERPWPLPRDPFSLETSVPGIFAAGDVRADSVKRCASAVGEGSMAIAFAHQHFEALASAAIV